MGFLPQSLEPLGEKQQVVILHPSLFYGDSAIVQGDLSPLEPRAHLCQVGGPHSGPNLGVG